MVVLKYWFSMAATMWFLEIRPTTCLCWFTTGKPLCLQEISLS